VDFHGDFVELCLSVEAHFEHNLAKWSSSGIDKKTLLCLPSISNEQVRVIASCQGLAKIKSALPRARHKAVPGTIVDEDLSDNGTFHEPAKAPSTSAIAQRSAPNSCTVPDGLCTSRSVGRLSLYEINVRFAS
jgi:hypothetical protein